MLTYDNTVTENHSFHLSLSETKTAFDERMCKLKQNSRKTLLFFA